MHPKWRSYDSGIVEAERCGGLLDQDFFDMDESTEIIPLTTGRYVTLRHLACPPQYARNDGVRRIILMSHGHSRNSYYGLKYSRIYYELGYETIIFDHRGHGVADYYPCTMGKDEGMTSRASPNISGKKPAIPPSSASTANPWVPPPSAWPCRSSPRL